MVQAKPGEESPDSAGQAARRKARRSDPWKVPQRRDRQRPKLRLTFIVASLRLAKVYGPGEAWWVRARVKRWGKSPPPRSRESGARQTPAGARPSRGTLGPHGPIRVARPMCPGRSHQRDGPHRLGRVGTESGLCSSSLFVLTSPALSDRINHRRWSPPLGSQKISRFFGVPTTVRAHRTDDSYPRFFIWIGGRLVCKTYTSGRCWRA